MPMKCDGLAIHVATALSTVDAAEVGRVIGRLGPQLRAHAESHGHGDSYLVDEQLQLARLAVAVAVARFKPSLGVPIEAYAYRGAKMAMRDCRRAERRRRARFERVISACGIEDATEAPQEDAWAKVIASSPEADSYMPTIEEFGLDEALTSSINQFLAGLPAHLRATATDIYWHGLSAAEVARKRSLTRMAVSKQLRRIRHLGRESTHLRVYDRAA